MIFIRERGLQLVETISFGRILSGVLQQKTLNITHLFSKPILIRGLFLSEPTTYTGSRDVVTDRKEILDWGTRYSQGLSIVEAGVETIFSHGTGDFEGTPIKLATNNGILRQRGLPPFDEFTISLRILPPEVFSADSFSVNLAIAYTELT